MLDVSSAHNLGDCCRGLRTFPDAGNLQNPNMCLGIQGTIRGHSLVQIICRTLTCVWGSRELLTTRIHSLRSQQRQSVLAFMQVRCEYILQL